jgi:hypothetical protein
MKMKGLNKCIAALVSAAGLAAASAALAQGSPLPVTINAWADSRAALKDRYWDGDVASDEHLSDIYVRYAGVGVTALPADGVEAYLEILFEEFFADPEGDGFNLDQAWIKLDRGGAFLRIGKMNFPFGHETTFAVEDPLTWYFSDCRRSGVEIGFSNDYLTVSGGAFNGDFDVVDDNGDPGDERVDDYALHLHFNPLAGSDRFDLEIGGGYISDITETELDFGNNFFTAGSLYRDPVAAGSGYIVMSADVGGYYSLALDAEYMESEKFSGKNYVDARGDETAISSANVELALFKGEKWWVGAQYAAMGGFDWLDAQAHDPALAPVWFESWGGFGGMAVSDSLTLATQVVNGWDSEGDTVIESWFQVLFEI